MGMPLVTGNRILCRFVSLTLLFLLALSSSSANAEDSPAAEDDPSGQFITPPVFQGETKKEGKPVHYADGLINLSGFLYTKGTRTPIDGGLLRIKESGFIAISDIDGYFEFPSLSPGRYTVVISAKGHEKQTATEQIVEGEIIVREYFLTMDDDFEESLPKLEKDGVLGASEALIEILEAQSIAGSQGEAVKAVQTLPGIAAGLSPEGVVIRGSSAEDSRILLDGHGIPRLYHLGGFKSIYNSDLLESLSLDTGGFDATHGNATGGIVSMKTARPRGDRWGGYVDASFVDTTAMVEGPITPRLTAALSFRRSTLDLILPLVLPKHANYQMMVTPVYYDYQGKLSWQPNERNTYSLTVLGGFDRYQLLSSLTKKSYDEQEYVLDKKMKTRFHMAIFSHRFKTEDFELESSPAFRYIGEELLIEEENVVQAERFWLALHERMKLLLSKNNRLSAGIEIEPQILLVDAVTFRPEKESDVAFTYANRERINVEGMKTDLMLSAYITDEITLGKFTVTPSVRFDYNHSLEKAAIDPRLNFRYRPTDALTFKAAAGLFHRTPDIDERFEPIGTKGLQFEEAIHLIAGVEWRIHGAISLDVQGYYKWLDELVTFTQTASGNREYGNNAQGYATGGEILLKHESAYGFYGWMSYAISRSMRNDGKHTPMRPFDYDQTHNLTLLASYKFLGNWQIGARFQFTSGKPYTEIEGGMYDSDKGVFFPVYDKRRVNKNRTGAYHRLDVRLDKSWVFNKWVLYSYIDIQNVYFHKNPVGTIWNYDFSEKGELLGLPIIPSFGLKGVF